MRGLKLALGLTNVAATGGGGGGGATTLDPARKSASVTLTNGNLTMQNGSTATFRSACGTVGKSSGKYYFERTSNAVSTSGMGVTNASASLDTWMETVNSAVLYEDGRVVTNSATAATYATWNQANVMGIAVDLDAKKLWVRKDATWQGGGDPATGTGGISISHITGTIYPFLGEYNASLATANFGATSYANAAPSGFSNWI